MARGLAIGALGLMLTACAGWSSRHHPPARTAELIVNGAPAGSVVFVDGVAAGPAVAAGIITQVVRVAPGAHAVEIHANESVVYREQAYAAAGERRAITVLSGQAP